MSRRASSPELIPDDADDLLDDDELQNLATRTDVLISQARSATEEKIRRTTSLSQLMLLNYERKDLPDVDEPTNEAPVNKSIVDTDDDEEEKKDDDFVLRQPSRPQDELIRLPSTDEVPGGQFSFGFYGADGRWMFNSAREQGQYERTIRHGAPARTFDLDLGEKIEQVDAKLRTLEELVGPQLPAQSGVLAHDSRVRAVLAEIEFLQLDILHMSLQVADSVRQSSQWRLHSASGKFQHARELYEVWKKHMVSPQEAQRAYEKMAPAAGSEEVEDLVADD
jgi:hypothetical protein